MSIKKWDVKKVSAENVSRLQQATGLSALVCAVLDSRGLSDPETADGFLNPTTETEDPLVHTDMSCAAECIREAVERGAAVAVFGDYDVDGITATALMYSYLQSVGADVRAVLPEREGEGYGLGRESVRAMAESGVELIITVDNGIAAYDEIEYANSLGLRVVVCDHHLPPEKLPPAYAVVDPKRKDDPSGCKSLAGVGMALRLAAAAEGCSVEELVYEYGALVAIGTIADIMPLTGDNRRLVCAGLEQLRESDNIGICALCEVAGIDLSAIDSRTVAFGIAPRLNAAGRMGDAADALRLLLTENEDEARQLAEKLDSLNRQRQQTEKDIMSDIEARIAANPQLLRQPVLVVEGENYHPGVVGIVASRLVEKYGLPAIVISINGEEAKGSGRSVAGFSLFDALCSCKDLLTKFGGHELAAGLTMPASAVTSLRERLGAYCENLGSMPFLSVIADCEIDPRALTAHSVKQLLMLEPFGCKNEAPVFFVRRAKVDAVTATTDGRHSRIKFTAAGMSFSTVMFSVAPSDFWFAPGDEVDLLLNASIHTQNGREYLSLRLCELRPSDMDEAAVFLSLSDCRGFLFYGKATEALMLSRADIAAVYRVLQKFAFPVNDLSALYVKCGELPAGRVNAVCDVLRELGLAAEKTAERTTYISAVQNPEKRSLEDSPTFIKLQRN